LEPDLPMSPRIGVLVIASQPAERQTIISILRELGHRPRAADSVEAAARLLAKEGIEAALLSLGTADPDAPTSLRRLRSASPAVAILLLAPAPEAARAVQLLRHGADDYVLSPPQAGELRSRLGRILEHRELRSRVAALESDLGRRREEENFVCRSQAMRALLARLEQVAPARTTVLIRGESGVGKELVARGIHYRSPRRDRPYVALNCAAIPETLIESELFGHERGAFTGAVARSRGKFELASHGTFFLDEVGELSLSAQARLLRVLEEQEFMRVGGEWPVRVDVRVLAATNADLESAVRAGRFREDLYFRLKVVTLEVPPLRERGEDVPELVRLFVERLCRANNLPPATLAPEAMAALQEYPWPGNVRELKNLLEGLLLTARGPLIRVSDLPPGLLSGAAERRQSAGARVGMSLADMERDLIRRTLESLNGNRTRAARILEIGVRTLQRKIRLYGLESLPARGAGRVKKTGERQDLPLPGGGAGARITALPSGEPFRR
jgi:DNA-binding NtrC family response regulator